MPILLALFFCSGACGLAYQVLWLRQLSYVFGVTAYAASTVLAAFMAGLALGSWLAGPVLARTRRPVAVFGAAELLIGLAAVTTPSALAVSSSVYGALYAVAPDAFALQTAARFACAFLVLLVPTMLMGMTLPLLAASAPVRGARFAARVSGLYAVNTAGAVGGALLTGFVLIGAWGMQGTFRAAALLNAAVGLAAVAYGAWLPVSHVGRETPEAPARHERGPRLLWAVMAASGFGSLALEVVWFRMLTQYVDATTYAFTMMLAVVLVGIAVGGAFAARMLRHERDWHAWLAATQLATGILVLLSVVLVTADGVPGASGLRPLQRALLTVLLPSLLLGFSFPVLLRLGVPTSQRHPADGGTRGRLVGRFYGVNVLGAILGALGAGFLLLPALGTRTSLIVVAGLFVTAGVALCLLRPIRSRMVGPSVAGLAGFAAMALAVPDPLTAAARLRLGGEHGEIFRDEGVQAVVSVHATATQRTLRVGGLHQANDSPDMVALHRRIGVLPMVLHEAPASALVIGLGGGATAGAVSQHPGTSVQIVELSDGVRKAAAYFAHVTYDVLNRPNVRVRVDDGRNFLSLSGERFDVVTADIIQPVHAGAGNLYSREYFQLVRRALRPGGIALQWIGHREKAHYELIMRTFLDVFPEATLWLDGQLMVGSLGPLTVGEAVFGAKLRSTGFGQLMAGVGLDSFEALRSWYTAGPREMAAFVGQGPRLTDDLPLLEYHRSLPSSPAPLDFSVPRGGLAERGPF